MPRFLVVCLNPTFQRTISLSGLHCGEVNRAGSSRIDISGKGVNTTRVLHQLGAEVRHLTHLGPEREMLLDLSGAEGLDIRWEPSDSRIRTCITLLHDDTGETTEIIEPTDPVDRTTAKKIRAAYEQEVVDSNWVIIAGTRTPGYPEGLYVDFVRRAAETGVKIVADFHGDELRRSIEIGLTAVKINLVEFARTFLPDVVVTEGDDAAAVERVKEKMIDLSKKGCDFVITRGGREVLFARKGDFGTHTPRRVKAVNTIGSGDSFTAGFTLALFGGANLAAAVREGARCGSINAGLLKPGSIVDA